MQLQNYLLALHMQGEDIKQLHQQLQHSGYTIPPTELEQAIFGEATKRAVLDFQHMHGLQPTGVVDQPTAELLGLRSEAVAQTLSSRLAPSISPRSGPAARSIIRIPPLPIPLPIPLPPDPGVRHQVAGQLLDQASDRLVVGFTIHGFDLDGGTTPVDLGSDITDKRG